MRHLIVLLLLLPALFIHSQTIHKCGTTAEDGMHIKQRMLENREDVSIVRSRNAVSYIPIRFIIMGTDAGSGYISETRCLEAICLLNEFYEDLGLIFYLKEFEFLNNTTVYNNAKCSTCDNFFSNYMTGRYNAMNIFIVNNAGSSAGGGTTLGFYAPSVPGLPRDYIVIRKSNLLDVDVTAHEVGHFFSLSHPFLGWEGAPYNDINPQPAPATAPSGQTQTERANGSNCSTAADGICDTPADYLNAFSPGHSGNCEDYAGGALDPLGVPIDPQEENIMSYFRNCGTYVLTPQQEEAVLDDVASTKRFYLKIGNPAPTNGPVTSLPQLLFPADDAQLDTYDDITLTWSAVDEATEYVVEIDNSSIFASPNFQRYFVSGTSLTVNLIEDAPYFWRVMPYNPVYTCSPFTPSSFFRTGLLSSTNTIPELEGWSISPNPVRPGQPIVINLNAVAPFDGTINIVDMTGRVVVRRHNLQVPAGSMSLGIETGSLQPGMYFVNMQSTRGVSSKKVILQ